MKQKKRTGIFSACVLSAAMACAVLAPQALAAEATPEMDSTSSTVSQYNLASENWEELLGVSSEASTSEQAAMATVSEAATASDTASPEESEFGSFFAGNKKSDGGASKLLIIAIIAFALGGIGVVWFIYSQFIYKAKLRRKMEAEGTDEFAPDYELDEESMEMDFGGQKETPPAPPVQEPPKRTSSGDDFFDDFEKQTQIQETPYNTSLSKEDEKKLKEVDWDDFFKNN